jgi:ubiquitin C-terminal hydrolase
MSRHAALSIRDQAHRIPANRRKSRGHAWHDLTDLLLRVSQMAEDASMATPRACQHVRTVLQWASTAQIKPGSVSAVALAECRRLIEETEHLRDRV